MFTVHTLWQTISYQILNLVNTPIAHFPEIHFNVAVPFLPVSDSGCFPTAFTSHFAVYFLAQQAQQIYQYENINSFPVRAVCLVCQPIPPNSGKRPQLLIALCLCCLSCDAILCGGWVPMF